MMAALPGVNLAPLVSTATVLVLLIIHGDLPRICHDGLPVLHTTTDRKKFLGSSRTVAPETLDMMRHMKKSPYVFSD
jgi:hypothetical protein